MFGGVLTTLLRSIGIATRQLTTFNSGHESAGEDGKYTHEFNHYYDANGKMIQQTGSIWNFHSWVETWIKREDLAGSDET